MNSERELLEQIHKNILRLQVGEKIIMAQLDDLNAAVEAISNVIAAIATNETSVLAELTALHALPGAPDLSGVIAKLTGAVATAQAADAALKAALPAVPPAVPPAA